jgi:hypothetical protein
MRIAMLTWESLHSVSLGGVAVHEQNLLLPLNERA